MVRSFKKILLLNLLLISSVQAVTYNDAQYNYLWTFSNSPGLSPGSNQNNTFQSTGPNPALIIYSGPINLSNSSSNNYTNTFNGDLSINGAGVLFSYNSSNGNLNNIFNSNVNVDGNLICRNDSNGSTTNTFNSDLNITNNALFSNLGTGNVTNIFNAVNFNGGYFTVGGSNSTTTIDTMNWNGGELKFMYANGSFGNTTINNLNIGSNPVTLTIIDNNYTSFSSMPTASDHQLFTVNNLSGNTSNITIQNMLPLVEVTNPNASNGFSVNGNTVSVNFVPVATSSSGSGDGGAVDTAADTIGGVVASLSSAMTDSSNQFSSLGSSKAAQWAPLNYNVNKTKTMLAQAFKDNPNNSLESAISTLVQQDAGKVVKFKGDYRVYATPYMTMLRNSGSGGYKDGFKEKYYGMLFGFTHYLKDYATNLNFMLGLGGSKTQADRHRQSHTDGKNIILGVVATKNIGEHIEACSTMNTMVFDKTQYRFGQPDPQHSYLARAKYRTYGVTWQNEIGYVYKIPNSDDLSLKPTVGFQLNGSRRSKFSEQNAGIYAQRYRTSIEKSGEMYMGMGLRKKWLTENYEGKITLVYEVGQKSGNGKSSSTVYAGDSQNGVTFSGNKPGRFTQYIKLYGSVFNLQNHWKVVPGLMATLQHRQKSLTATMKLEYRF